MKNRIMKEVAKKTTKTAVEENSGEENNGIDTSKEENRFKNYSEMTNQCHHHTSHTTEHDFLLSSIFAAVVAILATVAIERFGGNWVVS